MWPLQGYRDTGAMWPLQGYRDTGASSLACVVIGQATVSECATCLDCKRNRFYGGHSQAIRSQAIQSASSIAKQEKGEEEKTQTEKGWSAISISAAFSVFATFPTGCARAVTASAQFPGACTWQSQKIATHNWARVGVNREEARSSLSLSALDFRHLSYEQTKHV